LNIKKNWNRILGLLLVVVLVYWAVNNISMLQNLLSLISSAFMPFIVGGALAFILNLPMKIIEDLLVRWTGKFKKWYRIISIIVSLLIVGIFIYGLIFLVIPDLQQTITSFIEVVPSTIRNVINAATDFINNNPDIVEYVQELDIDFNNLQQQAISTVQSFASGIIGSTFSIISTTIGSVVTLFIALIFAIYVLSMKEALVRQIKKLVYGLWSLRWANYLVNVGKKANEIFSNFVGGQILEAIILGVLVYIGMTIFNFPYSLSVSAVTGALALIPIYGAFLGGFVGFVLISVVSFSQAIWFVVFIIVIQQLEGNIIYPRVVGNSVGLPGIWVLMVVSVGGTLFGLVGMLVAVPTVSLIYSLVSATINHRLDERNLTVETDSSNLSK
jgi:predicted PurR-regulated permease PerM